jgi:hypothetical protein
MVMPATAVRCRWRQAGKAGAGVGAVRFKAWQPARGAASGAAGRCAADLRYLRHMVGPAAGRLRLSCGASGRAQLRYRSRSMATRRRRGGLRGSSTAWPHPGAYMPAPETPHPEFPMTLDLRRKPGLMTVTASAMRKPQDRRASLRTMRPCRACLTSFSMRRRDAPGLGPPDRPSRRAEPRGARARLFTRRQPVSARCRVFRPPVRRGAEPARLAAQPGAGDPARGANGRDLARAWPARRTAGKGRGRPLWREPLGGDGHLPAESDGANPEWLRPLVGVSLLRAFPAFLAFEIGRGPDGGWWVLGDRTQAPSGAGYALENRVASPRLSRLLPRPMSNGWRASSALPRRMNAMRRRGWRHRRDSDAGPDQRHLFRTRLYRPLPRA